MDTDAVISQPKWPTLLKSVRNAQRRYRQLVPDDDPARWELTVAQARWDQFALWLEHDVCPIVGAAIARPLFREHATWPQRTLIHGAATIERQLIDKVDRALSRAALILWRLTTSMVAARRRMDGDPRTVTTDSAEYPDDGRDTHSRQRLVASLRKRVANLAKREATVLVDPQDYFGPSSDLVMELLDDTWNAIDFAGVTKEVGRRPGMGTSDLPVGEFITRCALQRVQLRQAALSRYAKLLLDAIRETGGSYVTERDRIESTFGVLDKAIAAVRDTVHLDASPIRESCIVLAQCYADFHPAPDLRWLGIPERAVERSRGYRKYLITDRHVGELPVRIAKALDDLCRLYDGADPVIVETDDAVAAGKLVLLESTREVYWQGSRVAVEWQRHPAFWEFLHALVEIALHGRSDAHPTLVSGVVATRRLRRFLAGMPGSFGALITSHEGSFALGLPASEITIFRAGI